jgi:hypothetical protein
MVDDHAQLYTIEGITAAIIMLVTAYLVLSTTTVFTPGDVHITDMQLEQTGNDVLIVMDTPDSFNITENRPNTTPLSFLIQQNLTTAFGERFNYSLNSRAGSGSPDKIQYNATVYYRNSANEIRSYHFKQSASMTGRENSIRVSRLVIINNTDDNNPILSVPLEHRMQAVLLEVLLWRS